MKNKIFKFLIIIICCLFLMSCDTTDNSNSDNNQNDSNNIIDGVDISKYEKPQTGFMHDGHPLSKLEEMMKYVIENGEFVFDYYSDGIGYKLELISTNPNQSWYAFYCVDTLRLVCLTTSGRTFESSYIKLNDNNDEFKIVKKIVYNSWRQDFYAIMNCNKQTFNEQYVGEYELYRGYVKEDELTITTNLIVEIDNLLITFNSLIKQNLNMSLSDIGYINYK